MARDRWNEHGESAGTYCTCGEWEGDYFADGESGPFDSHLSAALHAEVARWLADEGVAALVARQVYDFTDEPMWSAVVVARHALAALTPTPVATGDAS